MKKVISVILGLIVFIINVSAIVSAEQMESNIQDEMYFLSDYVPDSVSKYAKDFFSLLSYNTLIDDGFTQEEILNLSLDQALTAYEYDECDDSYFYFPVSDGRNIIAMLTVIDLGEGKYSAQFGKSDFADRFNKLTTSLDNPCILVITNGGMFAINKENEIFNIDNYSYGKEAVILKSNEHEVPDITFEQASKVNDTKVIISAETAYETKSNIIEPRVVINKNLAVPIVKNIAPSGFPRGICWAAATASVIKYRKGTQISLSATELRDQIFNTLKDADIPSDEDNIKSIFRLYIGETSYKKGEMSPYEIQKTLNSNKPIYTSWIYKTEGNIAYGHALVVRGIYQDTDLAGPFLPGENPNIGIISLMDCNYSNYQTVSCSGTYNQGVHTYKWYSSIY